MAKLSFASIRKQVFERANGLCEYCFLPEEYSASVFELEHIHPLSKGGKTILENQALSCSGCNKYKSHEFPPLIPKRKKRFYFSIREKIFGANILIGVKILRK